ncbi:MAG: hypothetical protein Q4G04_02420 [bacterium]|nr:hypothetical protein [bacterium]
MEVSYRNSIIIGIYGKARHGKDTVASIISKYAKEQGKQVITTQISSYIKYYAMHLTDWDGSEENKPRDFLQQFATEVVREKLNMPNHFINRTLEDLKIFSYFYDVIIISDIRLLNEIESLRNSFPNVKIIQVVRENFETELNNTQQQHKTETELENYIGYDKKIINTSLELLEKEVKIVWEGILNEKNEQ